MDGTTLSVPDSPAIPTRFTRQAGNHGGAGYPHVRLLALVACGTRTLIDAVSGPTTRGETTDVSRRLSGEGHLQIITVKKLYFRCCMHAPNAVH